MDEIEDIFTHQEEEIPFYQQQFNIATSDYHDQLAGKYNELKTLLRSQANPYILININIFQQFTSLK